MVGNADLTNDFKALSAQGRYVRIDATACGTIYGYSAYELEVYGQPVSSVATPRTSLQAGMEGPDASLRDHRGARVPLSANAKRAILEGRLKETSLPSGIYFLQAGSLPGTRTRTLVVP